MKKFYKRKKVLVAGGTGMIGVCLVNKLLELGSNVTIASLESRKYANKLFSKKVKFIQTDLTDFDNCLKVTKDQELVFNLVGIKGSVGIGLTKTASFLVPMLRFQTNLMDSAFKNNIKGFLFVSSICAYPESNKPKTENSVWDGQPKQNDRIPGLAKRIGEVQAESYLLEYNWQAPKIVRPSNVYGPYDNFNPKTAQVIPALIARMVSGENPIRIWGDGSAIRDFIFVTDVVSGMLLAQELAPPCVPINLGAGIGVTIKKTAQIIANTVPTKPKLEWDINKPSGDPVRILSMKRAENLLGFKAKTSLSDGINKTVEWYLKSDWYEKNRN
ncbi:MAG: NAD-dependent epimerase/dehydratase family protein [Candidatus Levybacteria bacterium]|nr:NAD-dependent epimerase/dehydratase family protein [Candidatus Levybacteria bacterium]